MRNYLASLIAFCFFIGTAQAASVEILTPTILPGQAFIARFDEQPSKVILSNKVLAPFPYQSSWRVVTAVPLTAKAGTQTLSVEFGTKSITKNVSIVNRKPVIVELPVPAKLNQTPKQLVKNLVVTNNSVNAAVKTVTEATRFNSPFALPLADNRKVSSVYGEVRKTGPERITHLGIDFGNPKGTVVAAINDGIVSKAYLDPVYGNSVHIDHGRGIFSLYLHLDTMRVKTGDIVRKGTTLGTLGETGLASGPHLHLSIKVGGVSVDPLAFVASFR
jgi:murein DD-endopeptidase MepM/ murein hydrolase activator NlpD